MKENKIPYKTYLDESEIPTKWYNVRADMKNKPAPLLNPATHQPMTAEELSPVFCEELVAQELNNTDAYIDIPQEIQDFYKMYRPSPLIRAYFLERALDTPAKIWQPQAQLRHRAGLLRQKAGLEGRHHRDRSRSVGHGAVDGLLLLWTRLQGLYGQGQL